MRSIVASVAALLLAGGALAEEKNDGSVRVQGKNGNIVIGPDGSVRIGDGSGAVNVGADGSVEVRDAGGSVTLPGAGPATAGAGAAETITANRSNGSRDCKGGAVRITGNNNHYTFTNCSKVSVLGNYNDVTLGAGAGSVELLGNYNRANVDSLEAASLPGNYNTVTWAQGAGGKDPRIDNPGRFNKVTRRP